MERRLGTPAVFALCAGAMFSSGFFLLPGIAFGETGPAVPLAYLAAGLLVLPAVFSIAELAAAMPRSGGPYHFLGQSLGPAAATVGAAGKYTQLLFKAAFAFVGVGTYLSFVVDLPVRPVAVTLVVLFTGLNLLGTKQSARVETALVVVLLVVLSYFLLAGGAEVAARADGVAGRFADAFPAGMQGFLAAVALVFVSFGGIGQVAGLAGEVRAPARSIPRGVLLALAVATTIYVAGTAAMVALVEHDQLRDDPAPVATTAAELAALPLPVVVVVVAALAAFLSTGNAGILSAARYPWTLAREGLLWSRFGRVSGRGVPRTSVAVTGILLVVLVLAFDVEGLAKLASAFLLLVFLGLCVAVVVLRRAPRPYRPGFASPGYPWMQVAGVLVYALLIVESGPQAWGLIAALVAGGTFWHHVATRRRAAQRQSGHAPR